MPRNQRIVSLVPSITELLFDLGLKDSIVGRTKFCIHPKSIVSEVQQFGGTKRLHIDKIVEANPTLIIANREENLQSEVEELQKHFDVLVTDVSSLAENNQMIRTIGQKTNTAKAAEKIIFDINREFKKLHELEMIGTVLYLIWNDPVMSIGGDTFINDMLATAGFKNLLENKNRYPVIRKNMQIKPDYIFLSSEPFPFKQKHRLELQKWFPKAKFVFVDGEMFSWYGSRIINAPEYFLGLRKELQLCN